MERTEPKAGPARSRLSARTYLLFLIIAAIIPIWLFAAYLLVSYALNEQDRFRREAAQTARQMAFVLDGELNGLLVILQSLAKSSELVAGNFEGAHAEARRLTAGTDAVVLLREYGPKQIYNSRAAFGSPLPSAIPLTGDERKAFEGGQPRVGEVYASPLSGEPRVPVALPVKLGDRPLILAITIPTAHMQNVLARAVPPGWVIGVGDRAGTIVTRSQMHEQVSGKPGLPDYLAKASGRSGTFTSTSFDGVTLLAGYYRSDFSGWLYGANVPLAVVQAPLWRSLLNIAATGLVAMGLSFLLAYWVGKGLAGETESLAARATALGEGRALGPSASGVREFAVVGDALDRAEKSLRERTQELETVLSTAPAAVWFTYDPEVRNVVRNRFAAELMGVPLQERAGFGARDDSLKHIRVLQHGHPVEPRNMPLQRAMRGEAVTDEEFSFVFPDGTVKTLLTGAHALRDHGRKIVGAVSVSLDISDRKRGEEQRQLLVQELNHRSKNTLAIVNSLAQQTLLNAPSLAEASSALSARLVALGKAHDILTRTEWSAAGLRDCIEAALLPHAPPNRFAIAGEKVSLKPSPALAVTMALHELATNAVKYGALSSPSGTIDIAWELTPGAAKKALTLTWRERGGPPVGEPASRGFGSRLIERVIGAEGGEANFTFAPGGLVCILKLVV